MDQTNQPGPESSGLENGVGGAIGVSALEQRQQVLSHHVRMVARKLSHALFVFGAAGGALGLPSAGLVASAASGLGGGRGAGAGGARGAGAAGGFAPAGGM